MNCVQNFWLLVWRLYELCSEFLVIGVVMEFQLTTRIYVVLVKSSYFINIPSTLCTAVIT
jgi:hypothetical protein